MASDHGVLDAIRAALPDGWSLIGVASSRPDQLDLVGPGGCRPVTLDFSADYYPPGRNRAWARWLRWSATSYMPAHRRERGHRGTKLDHEIDADPHLRSMEYARSGWTKRMIADVLATVARVETGAVADGEAPPRSRAWTWRERWAAEAPEENGVPGWWLDTSAAKCWRDGGGEAVWFLSATLDDPPWSVSVYRDQPTGPWTWDLDWNPPQIHRTTRDGNLVSRGTEPHAWLAMDAAEAAYHARPKGRGADPDCPGCWGWGYWCDHGGGPAHPCEPCDNGRECATCDGGSLDGATARRAEEEAKP